MEFRDLKKQYLISKDKIDQAIQEVLTDTNFISGKQIKRLEQQLADYVGIRHCITCANGTDALQLALMVWGIGEGDAVFVPDFTFFSTAEVVALVGATPIFVDIDKDTFNISIDSLQEAINVVKEEGKLRPKVIIAVDLFGQPAEYKPICEIAKANNLLLLEDGAQGFGGEIEGKRACSFGDISTTSFFPAKPLGCYGDGGAIFTDNDEWAELLRSYCVHGKGSDKYDNVRIGLNSRLDTMQAAILEVKFQEFREHEVDDVNRIAERYTALLRDCVKTPAVLPGYRSSWAQYCILCKDSEERSKIQEALKEENVPSMIYYRKPMHEQGVFRDRRGCQVVKLDNTTEACERILALPMHPYMEETEVESIANIIKKVTV